eukprot:CAMPEP_0182863694 /NCGR_PEP_ID=MMETSP0034_2-20130328/6790_1 /TAXON_ID=156128 /ORGANISM="Nephroselmis pyriformis, Strain CCMP717" /LENGTH=54 /DNA_ID=CAMNT_0024995933 /DNA_START=39 /DNA_END=203 /DNA_ORIENTATION=+
MSATKGVFDILHRAAATALGLSTVAGFAYFGLASANIIANRFSTPAPPPPPAKE